MSNTPKNPSSNDDQKKPVETIIGYEIMLDGDSKFIPLGKRKKLSKELKDTLTNVRPIHDKGDYIL